MKQAAQFGFMKKFPIGGGLCELEVLRALPKMKARLVDARMVVGPTEYPHVKEWVAAYQKANTGWHLPECAHLVRLRRLAFTSDGRREGQFNRAGQDCQSPRRSGISPPELCLNEGNPTRGQVFIHFSLSFLFFFLSFFSLSLFSLHLSATSRATRSRRQGYRPQAGLPIIVLQRHQHADRYGAVLQGAAQCGSGRGDGRTNAPR